MTVRASPEQAHDELLASMPPGASHDAASCPFCRVRSDITTTTEVTSVAAGDSTRTFTEAEHEAILAEAVRREVASATEDKDQTIAELQTRVDTLEAEKASLEQAKVDADKALEDFKTESEREREIASRRDARVAAVKRVSARELPESYFTDERVVRWAEMADESFTALLEDLAASAIAELSPEEASALEGLEGEARIDKLGEVLAQRREESSTAEIPPVRETAAFGGGQTPTHTETKDGASTTRRFLSAVHG